jgi:hypothetical protein
MLKTLKALLVIAVAAGMVQVAYLVSELLDMRTEMYERYEFDTLRRMLVYWFSGAISTVGAILLWHRERILSVAVGSGGIYLMTLGANGGLWTTHMLAYRLAFAVLNVAFFLIILRRISAERARDA